MAEHDKAILNPAQATAEIEAASPLPLSAEETAEHAQLAREFENELDALIDTLKPAGKRRLHLVPPPDPPGWPDF